MGNRSKFQNAMKISAVLLSACAFSAFAAPSDSQNTRVRISGNDLTVKEFIEQVEEQTDYLFVYSKNEVNLKEKLDISNGNKEVSQYLREAFGDSDIKYVFENGYIVLTKTNLPLVAQQKKTVKGVVKDGSGEAVIGANVVIKGTTTGSITDFDGNFVLDNVPDNAVLQISYIGYRTLDVPVSGKNSLNIKLEEDSEKLEEVVVVGYGTQKKGEITSSVTSVKAEDFNKIPVVNPMSLVEGRVAGLTISRAGTDPNGEVNIQLRGATSLKGNNTPLIIIDGVPGDKNSMNAIAPEDIEAIDVLKDGSAAAIYGTRGNNGVIIITTKRPKVGNSQVTYSGYVMHEGVYKRPEMLSRADYLDYGKRSGSSIIKDYGDDTDPYDMMLNKGNVSHVHNVTASGGTANMNYRASLGYRKNESIVKYTNRETINAALNVNHRMLNDKLLLSFNMSNSFTKSNLIPGYNDAADNPTDAPSYKHDEFYSALMRNPTMPIYNEDGSFWQTYAGYEDYNPIGRIEQRSTKKEYKNLLGNFKATYEILPGLKTAAFVALEKRDVSRDSYISRLDYSSVKDNTNGTADKRYEKWTNRTLEWTADYVKSFSDVHNLTAMIGYSYQDFEYEMMRMKNQGFLTDAFETNNMEAGSYLKDGRANMNSKKTKSSLIAFFGRVNYNFDGKYLFSASLRREGSSKFGADNKWAWFPSVSAGWMMTREAFMENVEFLDLLKFRAGFGITGSLPEDPYMSLIKYGTGAGNYNAITGTWINATYGPGNNPNPDLKWEKSESLNIGFDYGFWGGRVNGTIDWYQRTTRDLIYDYTAQQPAAIHDKIITNVGSMRNVGVELSISVDAVKTKNFTYTPSLTFSWEKNELTSLSNDLYKASYADLHEMPSPGNVGPTVRLQEGQPVGSFYGYVCDGIDENGMWKMRDLDGKEGLSMDDRTFIGCGLPKYKASLQNTFTYKNFDFGFLLRGMFDYDILNEGKFFFGTTKYLDQSASNVYKDALNHPLKDENMFSNYYLEDGSFLKIDNVTLGYTFNFNNNKYIKNLRLYGTVTNLVTITGYSGLTPDINVTGLEAGCDSRSSYPVTRTFSFGVNATF